MMFPGIVYCLFLAAVVTSQVTLLEPEPFAGSHLASSIPTLSVTEGASSAWSHHPEDPSAASESDAGFGRRSLTQVVAGNCKITIRNLCPTTRYFLIAYRTVKGGKNGFFTEGWFNIAANKDAIIPEQIRTQEPLADRQWYIRLGDGIKLGRELLGSETARCIDKARPFNTFSTFPGTALRACRYDGAYAGKCGTCASLGGVAGHGFYSFSPAQCTGTLMYTFAPANRNC